MWQALLGALPALGGSGGGGSPLSGLGGFFGGTTQTSSQSLSNTISIASVNTLPSGVSEVVGSPVNTNAQATAVPTQAQTPSFGELPVVESRYDNLANAPQGEGVYQMTDNNKIILAVVGVSVVGGFAIFLMKGRK